MMRIARVSENSFVLLDWDGESHTVTRTAGRWGSSLGGKACFPRGTHARMIEMAERGDYLERRRVQA